MQAPQSPWSQPFLTPKKPSSRRKVLRHCPGAGSAEKDLPFTAKFMPPLRLLELGADLLGVVVGEPPPIGRRAMHVVEIAVGGNRLVDGVAKLGGRRRAVEFDLHRPWRCRGDGEQQIGIVGAPRADEEHRGAAEMGERGAMRGEALVQRARGDMDVAQELARLQHVGVVAGDEVDGRHFTRAPIAGQQRVAGLERRGERHHRACRQRHADIAADRRRVPDLERGEKGAGAELKQRRRDPVRPAA